jgi:hypothetical protein
MVEMNALLMTISLWLSMNFGLPTTDVMPHVEHLPPAKIAALHLGAHLSAPSPDVAPESTARVDDIMSVYDDAGRTIFLREGWTGATPAELSIVVHEMVHHFQNLGGLKYACAQEREKLAYEAQERWLGIFGKSLESEFQIDGFSRLAKTACLH